MGHAGTLDPFATGLLLLLVGRATRLARFLERYPKAYRATAVLGTATDTDDLTGTVVQSAPPAVWPDRPEVDRVAAGCVGRQLQRPPAYSARRVEGRRAYRLARAGEAVELPATPVEIFGLTVLDWSPPTLEFAAEVSSGTYIRSLGRDLGLALGSVGHLTALRRTGIGPHRVEDAVPLDRLDPGAIRPAVDLLPDLPAVDLAPDEARAVGFGQPVPRPDAEGLCRLVAEGRLAAVAEGGPDGWQPRVVLEPA